MPKPPAAAAPARAPDAPPALTPLEYLLSVLRDPGRPEKERFEAAKAAAPYVHARLSSVDHSGEVHLTHEDALDELD